MYVNPRAVRQHVKFSTGTQRHPAEQQQVLRRRLRLHDHGRLNSDVCANQGARPASARRLLLQSAEQARLRRADHHSRAVLPAQLLGAVRRFHGRGNCSCRPALPSLGGDLARKVGAVIIAKQRERKKDQMDAS